MYKHVALSGSSYVPPAQQFSAYTLNTRFYFRPSLRKPSSALPIDRNFYRTPRLDQKFQGRTFYDARVDMTAKENLDVVEMLRHPRERDYYQDHTYHNEWIARDLTAKQAGQLTERYYWMVPGHQIEPWVWFPGDVVEVVSGDFSGQRGTILNVVKYKNEAYVQNVNVQPLVIPASETRPEQTIQREHAVSVTKLKLVDPSTNEPCDVRLVTVRDKDTGSHVQRRMSLTTGTLLPLPKPSNDIDVGDPMHDTPLEDAREPTYMEDKELPVIVARKLRAIEDNFVRDLKTLNDKHDTYRAANDKYLRRYQQEVVKQAAQLVISALIPAKEPQDGLEHEEHLAATAFTQDPHWREAASLIADDVYGEEGDADAEGAAEGAAGADGSGSSDGSDGSD
jgi:large subunit ribosomal protein L24